MNTAALQVFVRWFCFHLLLMGNAQGPDLSSAAAGKVQSVPLLELLLLRSSRNRIEGSLKRRADFTGYSGELFQVTITDHGLRRYQHYSSTGFVIYYTGNYLPHMDSWILGSRMPSLLKCRKFMPHEPDSFLWELSGIRWSAAE